MKADAGRDTHIRLFTEAALESGGRVKLTAAQTHYLTHVMRLRRGDGLAVFNGRDGEWRARVASTAKAAAVLDIGDNTRPQETPPDIWLLCAPVKRARMDYLAQKATEMGVSRLVPVITEHTQNRRVNLDRLQANAIEAAEQCGRLSVPEIAAPVPLAALFDGWEAARRIVFCNPDAEGQALEELRGAPLAVLVGPEGGFSNAETAALDARPETHGLNLGARILRTDTAVVAALALVQSRIGDWRGGGDLL